MELKLYDRLTDELYFKQLRELLILGDREFIPPLSARSSTTQQGLATASDSDGGIDAYFEEMKAQSFVLALEGERLAGFMSFRKNHTGPHIPEAKNLYASTCVVHPDFRGQGLMTSFYREMIRAYPALPIFTRTWHQNAGHLKVLEKMGFRLLETVENDRGQGIHTVYYGRTSDLNPPLAPAFGETDFHEDRISNTVRVLVLHGVEEDALGRYCALLEKDGYVKKESDEKESYQYAAYEKDGCGYFLNYFPAIRELTLVRERDSAYFSYEDRMLEPLYTPTVTQIALKDFGMSYVIRLSDGRLILFDGGREFDEDVEHLWDSIRAISPFERPVIAAWILSHAHCDHFHCCHRFLARYGHEVEVEKFFLNFPEYDDEAHFAEMIPETHSSPRVNVPLLWEQIRRSRAKVYTPHSGQSYTVGDAQLLFFAAMDETIHCAKKINASSLVFRMSLGGQTILWTSDVSSSVSRLPERYGNELRADILQVPHHGFRCGTDKAEIALYNFAKA
ncbi:MAG: GNAT family N-acetyltransferase, partial [Clostridia bacterium]|nr:GNAT family N-acetyltransferase [Clostridia bacterium]